MLLRRPAYRDETGRSQLVAPTGCRWRAGRPSGTPGCTAEPASTAVSYATGLGRRGPALRSPDGTRAGTGNRAESSLCFFRWGEFGRARPAARSEPPGSVGPPGDAPIRRVPAPAVAGR